MNRIMLLFLFITSPLLAEDTSYELSGYLHGVHVNGGLNTSEFYADLALQRQSDNSDFRVRAVTQRTSRPATQEEDISNDANQPNVQRFSIIEHVEGHSGIFLTYRQTPRRWVFGLAHERNPVIDLSSASTYSLGYRQLFFESTEVPDHLAVTVGIAGKSLRQDDNTNALTTVFLALDYSNWFTQQSSVDLRYLIERGDNYGYQEASVVLHFWLNRNTAIGINNTTRGYDEGYEIPEDLGGTSTSITTIGLLIRR